MKRLEGKKIYIHIKQNRRYKKAYSLVEIMVAASMLVLVIGTFYSLFTGAIRAANIGDWKSRSQFKIRVAMKQLHMDISAATYPSLIALNQTTVDRDKKWMLKYKSGKTDVKNAGDVKLLEFYICTPGKNTPVESIPKKIIKAVLSVEKKDSKTILTYQKELIEGNAEPGDSKRSELVEDAVFFDASLIKPDAEAAIDRAEFILKVEIGTEHPQYAQTCISEVIEVPLHVHAAAM